MVLVAATSNMGYIFVISVVVALLLNAECCYGAILPKAGCSISVNQHLSNPQPLLLLQNGAVHDSDAFPLPVDTKGTLVFATGETIDLACPGSAVRIDGSNTGKSLVEARCVAGVTFAIGGRSVPFASLTCTSVPYHTARYTGQKCATKYREIEIGFNVNNRFIRHIISCYDDVLQNVVYTHFNLSSTIGGFQSGYPRPDFLVGSFYDVSPSSVATLYTRNGQRKTINNILGLSSSDTSVIHPTNDYFLAKGHYVAKADYVYGTQQRATFYYVNVAPQWQTFNGGNWNILEGNCRNLASNRGLDLVVYTGSFGIATLPDSKGREQELYLYVGTNGRKGIPVPALYYKVLYDPKSQAGIALIGINNPYKKITGNDIICEDVCDKVNWLTWKKENVALGYSYCCEVNDFRKTVSDLPPLNVKSLLV